MKNLTQDSRIAEVNQFLKNIRECNAAAESEAVQKLARKIEGHILGAIKGMLQDERECRAA